MPKKRLFVVLIAGLAAAALVTAGATAGAKKPYVIEISGLWAGTNPYTVAVAWAKLINAESKIVKAVAREGRGPNVDMKTLIKYPEKRGHLVFFQVEDSVWGAKKGFRGWKAFKGKFDFNKFTHICLIGFTADVLLTTKPNIKVMKDLTGRSVCVSNVSATSAKAFGFIETFKAAGVKPRYRYLGMRSMVSSLRDGLLDVGHGGINVLGPGKYAPSPYLNQLFATRKVYAVSLDKAAVMKMKKSGHPGIVITYPAGAVSKYTQRPVVALGKCMTWGVDSSMPDWVVQEILRIYLKHIDKFGKLTPGARVLNKKTIAAIGVGPDRYHPAALAFFKKHGIKITSLHALGIIK